MGYAHQYVIASGEIDGGHIVAQVDGVVHLDIQIHDGA